MLERLDFADSEVRSGELQVWVPNFPFLHVAFIIRRDVNSSDAEYFFSSSFAVCLYAHSCIFGNMPMITVLFCFQCGSVGGVGGSNKINCHQC